MNWSCGGCKHVLADALVYIVENGENQNALKWRQNWEEGTKMCELITNEVFGIVHRWHVDTRRIKYVWRKVVDAPNPDDVVD